MQIVVFYQYFSTPNGRWSTRFYHLAKHWTKRGHQVTVVTSVYDKSDLDELLGTHRRKRGWVRHLEVEGIRLVVLAIPISNRQSFSRRIASFLCYALLSCWFALRLPADLVIASSGPITVGLPALVARLVRRRRLVFECRDLWPEGAIALGALRNPLLTVPAFGLARACYRAASLVVTLSRDMADHLRGRFAVDRLAVVPNGVDLQAFADSESPAPAPSWLGDRQVLLYTGNLGPTNGSALIETCARRLEELGETRFLLVLLGEGPARASLQRLAEDLDTLVVLGPRPKREVVFWLRRALAALVPLADAPILATSSPNKLFEALAAGVPVIQTTDGWIAELLADHRCGYTVPPQDPDAVIEALRRLADDPEARRAAGRRARTLAREQFDLEKLADRYLASLHEAYGS
ncbi:Glycosyltransferase family 4 protein [Sulfidibacter corallicola]|uniref:Glycosyltransferase family 4 protein n=1 Tax=Sulfidibacter corallicola TaxID=2818388 RepID=A0A8A4TWJ1_SULCO|nr:glycosyltransferase family 4 protein [Sulfidibacter corallicola]QTD53853.1 glycosyltransferase family 4 protein [Sulfidibacter corallicola]